MHRFIAVAVSAAALAAAAPALGAANPNGTGQPSQSCQNETSGPPGIFSKNNGFATTAVNVYAGSPDTPSLNSNNSHVVSQYDVACFQVSTR